MKLTRLRFSQLGSLNRSAYLFVLATVLNGVFFAAWGLFFNFYILGLGFDREFLGLVNGIPSAAALLLGLPLGMLSDRIGRKRSLLLGYAIYLLSFGTQAIARSPGLIILAGFLGGAGDILYFVSQAPLLARLSNRDNRNLLFSLNFGMMTLSGVIGNLLGGQMPGWFESAFGLQTGSAASYQAVLLASVVLATLVFIPLALMRPPERKPKAQENVENRVRLQDILRKRIAWQLTLPNLSIGLGAAMLVPYFNLFFVERFRISEQSLGVLFSLSALITGLGAFLGPRLAKRLGTRIRSVVLTQGSSLLFLLLMGFSPVLGLAAVGFLARSMLMNMAVPLYESFSMDQVLEAEQGRVNSIQILGWEFGWTVGPYISGLVQLRFGFTPLFVATACLYALAISLTWTFFRDSEAPRVSAPIPRAAKAD